MAPVKRRKTNPEAEPVAVIAPSTPQTSTGTDASTSAAAASTLVEGYTEEAYNLALELVAACLAADTEAAKALVARGADAWVQNGEGWTALHAAASVGDVELVQHLLRKGNAVWNVTDNIGNTAGDIAWSLNENEVYELLLGEGVRSEMLRAVMQPMDEDDEDEVEVEATEEATASEAAPTTSTTKKSTASDNAVFLASKLVFTTDAQGQEVCLDVEGNGVMMGWERELMRVTAEKLCSGRGGQGKDDEFNVVNVDSYFQTYSPTTHLIIEPHPDVLAHARSKGWYEKPGVRFYEGTWKDYVADMESGKEEYISFDAVYFDTYSEHYRDLHDFFDVLPNILRSPDSRFSFFHGLGATSRNLYDVYTTVSELHLRETGLTTEWSEVDIYAAGVGVWDSTERRYWGDVGPYRLPICWLEM